MTRECTSAKKRVWDLGNKSNLWKKQKEFQDEVIFTAIHQSSRTTGLDWRTEGFRRRAFRKKKLNQEMTWYFEHRNNSITLLEDMGRILNGYLKKTTKKMGKKIDNWFQQKMHFPTRKHNYGIPLGSTADDICTVIKMKMLDPALIRKLYMVLLGNLRERKEGRCVFERKKSQLLIYWSRKSI